MTEPSAMKRCTVEGCEGKHKAKGLCGMHYQRVRTLGSSALPVRVDHCTVEGCAGKHYGLGLCEKHYYRRRRALREALLPPAEGGPMTKDEFRRQMWAHETERAFQTRVINLAKALGWGPIYHTQFSLGSKRGYPDLHMLRGGRSLFAELKAMRGRVTPEQEMWLEALRAAGHEAYLWRPSDIDEIEAVLAAKDRPR